MMNDPIEELLKSIPLRSPSPECDQNVLKEINLKHSPVPLPSRINFVHIALATAASLLIGFFAGTAFHDWSSSNSRGSASAEPNATLTNGGGSFVLADNIKVLDGQSKTIIVGESIQLQNNVPVRKVETVTHKKVLVRDQADNTEREVEIPIRKIFFTLAETI